MIKRSLLPTALVIGAPRSGTTSLFFYLKQHPDIYLPDQKELHYFTYDLLAQNRQGPGDAAALEKLCSTVSEYEEHFAQASSEPVRIDISPSYLYYHEVSERIKIELGEVKIIALLRNPIEKAYSQYMHLTRLNLEQLDFYEALIEEPDRKRVHWSDIWRYAESSLYASALESFIGTFGRENVLIILTEEFAEKPMETMQTLFKFLSVDQSFPPDISRKYNKSGRPRSTAVANFFGRPNRLKAAIRSLIPESIRAPIRMAILDLNSGDKGEIGEESYQYLMEYFKEDIIRTEMIIGRKTSWNSL